MRGHVSKRTAGKMSQYAEMREPKQKSSAAKKGMQGFAFFMILAAVAFSIAAFVFSYKTYTSFEHVQNQVPIVIPGTPYGPAASAGLAPIIPGSIPASGYPDIPISGGGGGGGGLGGVQRLTGDHVDALKGGQSKAVVWVVSNTCPACTTLVNTLNGLAAAGRLQGVQVGLLFNDQWKPDMAAKYVPQAFVVGKGTVTPGPTGALSADAIIKFLKAQK